MNTKTLMIGVAVIVALGALAYTQLPKDGTGFDVRHGPFRHDRC